MSKGIVAVLSLYTVVAVAVLAWPSSNVGADAQTRVDTDTLQLAPALRAKITEIEAMQRDLRATGFDPVVANISHNIIKSLVLSPDAFELGSWAIHPVGNDRVVIHGRFLMTTAGRSKRTYTFAIMPESAAP